MELNIDITIYYYFDRASKKKILPTHRMHTART